MFLRVSPMKGVMGSRRKVKLSPNYIWPFEILQIVGEKSYELELPQDFAVVHPVFNVSIVSMMW